MKQLDHVLMYLLVMWIVFTRLAGDQRSFKNTKEESEKRWTALISDMSSSVMAM